MDIVIKGKRKHIDIAKGKRKKKRDLNQPIHFDINDKKVSVFTQEFLEENKLAEVELRKLRKLNNDYEEHNSVLVKYIENLSSGCEKICAEIEDVTQYKDSLTRKFNIWKSEVKDKFGTSSAPT